PFIIRDRVIADPSTIGQRITITVPASDPYDQLRKGLIDRATPEENRRLKDFEIAGFDKLVAEGQVSDPFNWAIFTNADSRFPELAGLRGALVGSFYALLTCFLISFPIGIGAAIYLEEFAPKNRISDIIEININNLAAVPSVVFGLLALAVFLGWFGLPRGAPFVGGMTLALMTLPTIIIATRAALKAVPPSIREAALGIGASRQQVVFHHVLPLAMPGILTGTIIGLAQALGETAPLLLIGMNAFITAAPATPFESATALPTQIFIWADSPERGFVSRTSAAILVLLGFLVLMNGLAVWLRSRFERTW
ncbi:MAG TPA: phosphate ABC transporter permease PstA, partial [Paracoccaceae bacterium]|nr:phosphate ABC transporter permease PstA [Paracoccaceae bacterium]